ncbi:MAG: molybdopterin-dependent oxidoreductase, partial [Actinomycetota bacterium]|nr:molybdopterin-dependent oxidoreductase [Actinomycetota bacterium]
MTPTTRPPVSKPRAALTGAVAAGAALAAGELTTSLVDPGPTLVTAVGSEFIDRFAASLKDLAVAIFGTNDKPALVAGIVVMSIVFGALLGLAARRRFIVAPIGFAAFGLVGAWALSSDPQGATGPAVLGAIVSVVAGVGTFALLWRAARRPVDVTAVEAAGIVEPTTVAPATTAAPGRTFTTTLHRRRFVLGVGGVVVASGAATSFARGLRHAESVDATRRATVLPRTAGSAPATSVQSFEIPGLTPYIIPNADFYRIDTALSTPQVAVDEWRLSITGLVDEPFELTFDELLALDSVEETVTIQCVSNEVGGGLVGNAVWQGVRLATLLERAGVQGGATQIVGRSVDGWTAGFPTEAAIEGRTALVAYAMNGEPLPADHGFPARLIVAGLYGYVSATKWLEEIELTTWEAFDGYWVPRGWSKEG